MSQTEILIFSKNRTLQLKSLLRSIRYYSDIEDPEITILYTTLPTIPYEDLIQEFGCRFVREQDFFDDLKGIIEESKKDYILFMVDDLIFKDEFSLRHVESVLNIHSAVNCFALRLGKNIHGGKEPLFEQIDSDMLVWDTGMKMGRIWRSFWEVSSSIYRKPAVLDYLKKCTSTKITHPNPFESHYYSQLPSYRGDKSLIKKFVKGIKFFGAHKSDRMSCFSRSVCFTQGVNLVADRTIEHQPLASPKELHESMNRGLIIDYQSIKGTENHWPNAGVEYFRLVRDR